MAAPELYTSFKVKNQLRGYLVRMAGEDVTELLIPEYEASINMLI
jgi:hypothetical protein